MTETPSPDGTATATLRTGTAPSTVPATAGILGFVVFASLLLLTRTYLGPVSGRGGGLQLAALIAIFGSILVASCLVPVPDGRATARLGRGTVLAVGLVAFAGAIVLTGRPLPLPLSPWALPVTVLAAVAEEALFRRAAYGALERFGAPVAIVGTALAFGLLHVPLYGLAVLPVDLGAGLLLSWQRWASGTWTVPAGTHAAANALMVLLR